jgi:hypothetical protein
VLLNDQHDDDDDDDDDDSTRSRDLQHVRSRAAHAGTAGPISMHGMVVSVLQLQSITLTHIHGSSDLCRLFSTKNTASDFQD